MDVYEALGLSEGEKKVYRALIKLKSTTTGPLYKSANVSQSKVYEILERLKKKGLVSSIIKKQITYWQPANPSIYLEKIEREAENIEKRKEVLKERLPSLLKEETYPEDEAQVFVGYNGVRNAIDSFGDTFKKGEEMVVLGTPKPLPNTYYTFFKLFNKERVKKGVKMRVIYGDNMRSYANKLYDMPKTNVKFLKGLTPSTLAIGKDRIVIATWEEGGKAIVITGKEIANNYKKFFESLWKMSKE